MARAQPWSVRAREEVHCIGGDFGQCGYRRDDGHTGRRARFTTERVVSGRLLAARETAHTGCPDNPPLTD